VKRGKLLIMVTYDEMVCEQKPIWVNRKTKIFHFEYCERFWTNDEPDYRSMSDAIKAGYRPCHFCYLKQL
jgi:hypothetical protein